MISDRERASAQVIYEGPIRSGGADSGFEDGFSVKELKANGLVFLDPIPVGVEFLYEDSDYWANRYGSDGEIDFDAMSRKLGREQSLWLEAIGPERLAGKSVADIGAGSGLFLDQIQSSCTSTSGVEVSSSMRNYMEKRGHAVYSSTEDCSSQSHDVCVSFDVLEHAVDPLAFLRDARRILKPGGVLHIGVPNQRDFLKDLCTAYLPFFYHKSHLYYFTDTSLRELLERAGFIVVKSRSVHKYNFMNVVNWLRDAKPTGVEDAGPFDAAFEQGFRENIERQGRGSHILLEARNP